MMALRSSCLSADSDPPARLQNAAQKVKVRKGKSMEFFVTS